MLVEDLAPFFALPFGVSATVSGTPLIGIYDDRSVIVLDVEGIAPTLLCRTADLPGGLAQGATVTVGSASYKLCDIQPDGTGLTLLILEWVSQAPPAVLPPLDPFFVQADFAVPVVIGAYLLYGIFDDAYKEDLDVVGHKPQVLVKDIDIPAGTKIGDPLKVNGSWYAVAAMLPDTPGATLILLEVINAPSFTIDISGSLKLAETWLDEENPSTAHYADAVVRVRYDYADDHGLIFFYNIPASLPAGAIIDSAEYWAWAASGVGAPGWNARKVLIAAAQTKATWLLRAQGLNWYVSGCMGSGTDYSPSPVMGSGTGIAAGWNKLLFGADFTAAIAAAGAGTLVVVFHDDTGGSPGTLEFTKTGQGHDPYLRVVYHLA